MILQVPPPIQTWRHHGSRSLKMQGMSQAVTHLIDRAMVAPLVRVTMARDVPAFDASVPILSQLLKAELAGPEVRSIACHMKSARFPACKDLSGFDVAASEINEATLRQLHRCPRQRARTGGDTRARSWTGRRTWS